MKKEERKKFYSLLEVFELNSKALILSLEVDDEDNGDSLSFEECLKDFQAVLLDNQAGLNAIKKINKKWIIL